MHEPNANMFALVENVRPVTPSQDEATEEMPTFNFDGPIDWDKLAEDHAIAYLRGDLATSSPESYTIEEMKAISDGMFASTAEVEATMRADFQAMPKCEQERMLQLLASSGTETREWWARILL